MTGSAITELFERLARLTAATKQKAGDRMAWDYTFPDGETHPYKVRGLKSHAQVEDSAFNLLIWVWNAKDYLKRRAESNGKNAQMVEDAVSVHTAFAVCADLANRLKHGDLKRSRSGQYPRFGVVSFEAPQAALGSLTFRAFEVEMDITNPALVDFHLPVIDSTGREIGDVFEYAGRGVAALELLGAAIEGAV
jgi:hypothetical protein